MFYLNIFYSQENSGCVDLSMIKTNPVSIDEDEIYFGPIGHKEKCVAIAVTEAAAQKYKPLSPLSAHQMAELCKEANTVACRIELANSTLPPSATSPLLPPLVPSPLGELSPLKNALSRPGGGGKTLLEVRVMLAVDDKTDREVKLDVPNHKKLTLNGKSVSRTSNASSLAISAAGGPLLAPKSKRLSVSKCL